MKADRHAAAAVAQRLDPGLRLLLLHGSDESASRDIAQQIARQFAQDANPLAINDVPAASLKDDPALLAAAASEISMFGDRTLVRVADGGEDCLDAVRALLAAGVAGNPVVVVAGVLRKGSALLALAEASPAALALASYPAEARNIAEIADAIAADAGLRLGRGVARALFAAFGGDRGMMRQEVEKLALYVDATPGGTATVELADLAAVGSDTGDAEIGALVDAVAGGRPEIADRQVERLTGQVVPGIVVLRGTARRFWQLLELRLAVDGGMTAQRAVDAARPPIFWKDKPQVAAQVERWHAPGLRRVLAALLDTERAIKRSGTAGDLLARQALVAVARQAARG